MAKIKLNGDTSGYIEISAPAVSGNNTLELGPGTKILTNLDNTFTGVSTFTSGLHVTGGNLGIGTNNPDATLKVNVASGNNGVVVQNTSTANIALLGARNGDATVQIGQWGSTASGSTFGLSNADLSFIYTTSYSTTHPSALALGTVSNKPIVFATNNTEKLRIDSSGRLMLGQTSAYAATGTGTMMLTVTKNGSNRTDVAISNQFSGDNASAAIVLATHGQDYILEATGSGNTTDGTRAFRILKGNDERLRITSDGNFGIGENSPADRLVVQKTNASGDVAVRIKNDTLTDGSASTPTTASLYLNTSTSDFNSFYIQARRYDNDTHFGYSNPRDGGHTPNMIITNEGRITKPNQPCAMAYNAQGQHMAGAAVAQFNSTRFNIGNMYNSSNGRMTVPVDGRYLVAYSGLHDYISQNAIGFDIRINGSTFNGGEGYQEDSSRGNSQLSKTLILSLSANDYVEIYIRQSGTQVHQRYGSFSMCLLT